MIYMDNAATSFPKPPETEQAMMEAVRTLGNAGRGAHGTSLAAGRKICQVREMLAEMFHAEDSSRIAFTQNTTQALNTAILGTLGPGDHVITTMCDHNSVLRPLYLLEKQGVALTIIPADSKGRIDYDAMRKAVRSETKAIVVTHASNLTGNVTDLKTVAEIAEYNGLLLIVDAAQTAGILPIDVQKMGIDILCFPGHKGLLGPQGTGGIYVRPGVTVRPLMVGGSGVKSFDHEHPQNMPASLEAGTMNAHGIAGLGGGISFIRKTGMENIRRREDLLAWRFLEQIREINEVTVYGDFSDGSDRVATIALNIGDMDSGEVAERLAEEYDIAVRAGAHCAPLMHKALGTGERGAVRFSFSYFNTEDEINRASQAVREIAEDQ
ncbi:MAG: aminotransferase class V-fold PLP-dependent enzyme [Eubacteriales bacterium]|jgi:cysteine desulfurase family protein